MKIQKIKNFGKKFFASIVLAIFTIGIFIPTTHAIYNPRYDFLKTGGEPIILPFIPPIDYNGQKFEKEIVMDTNANYMQHISLMYAPVVEKYKDTNLIQSDFNALFLYIKPEGLKNNPIILSNKNHEAVTYENGAYKPFNDGHFVDSIFYDADDKKIKIIGGGGQYENGHVGMYNQAVIAENVDENTPDFILFVQIQQMYMKNTDGTIRLNSRYLIFRETELGNGELVTSDDAITLVTSTPINQVTPSYFSTNNNSVIPVKMKFDQFLNFCFEQAGDRNESGYYEKYYLCTEGLQPAIMNVYGHIWENQFGLKLIEGNGEVFDDHGLGDKYETIPPFGNGFKGVEYEKCETLEIGCHIKNLGKAIYNGIGSIFTPVINGIKNIWNGFADVIKGIFVWVWESGKNFFLGFLETEFYKNWIQPIYTNVIQVVWKFFWSFFEPLWDVVTLKKDPHSFFHGDQNRICELQTGYYIEHNTTWYEKPAEFFQMLFFLSNPVLPDDNTPICTSLGMKELQYGKNTLLDTTLFLIFFVTGIWFSLFIIRPH